MDRRDLARLRWALLGGLGVSSCLVSFDDYPVLAPDGGVAASGGTGGLVDSSWADATAGGTGPGGGGGVAAADSAAGSGASGGASGGDAGAGGVGGTGAGGAGGGGTGGGGTGGSSGVAGSGGQCLTCDETNACGSGIDNQCGGQITCECKGVEGCSSAKVCESIANAYCGACVTQFPIETNSILTGSCGVDCGAGGTKMKLCVKPGEEMNAVIPPAGQGCPSGFHLTSQMNIFIDCTGATRILCVAD